MKAFTDLEQSKKLAEILQLESADLYYYKYGLPHFIEGQGDYESIRTDKYHDYVPCWSLTALVKLFNDKAGLAKDYGLWYCYDNGKSHCTKHYDNPIDAAFEMIVWLLENKKI